MKKIFIFTLLFIFLFIPRIYAEGNFYELKLYDNQSSENLTETDNHALTYLFQNRYLDVESNEEGFINNVTISNKKLFSIVLDDENYQVYRFDVEDNLTANDNYEFIFNSAEKEAFQNMNSELKDYDGIDLMLAPIKECDGVCIKRVSLFNKSDNAIINSKATFDGLNINFDVSVKEVNDFVKYKVIISNPTNEEYEISESNKSSEYITYEYSFEDNDKTLKNNSDKVVYITIKYANVVPESAFTGHYFNEVEDLSISLGNGVENPKTFDATIKILVSLGIVVICSLLLYKYTNKKEFIGTMAIALILIPVSIFALQKIEINIKSKVQIVNNNFSGAIYRNDECVLNVGDNYNDLAKWEFYGRIYDTEEECQSHIEEASTKCKKISSFCEYYDSSEQFDEHNKEYIKNEIVNNIVTKNYVCQYIEDKTICLEEGKYENNKELLLAEQDWIESHGGSCINTTNNSGFMCNAVGFKASINENETRIGQCYTTHCPLPK